MEMILDTNSLQPYLTALIPTKKVCIRRTDNGIINLLPYGEPMPTNSIDIIGFIERRQNGELPECIAELYGMYANSGDTLDDFMTRKHADKALDL